MILAEVEGAETGHGQEEGQESEAVAGAFVGRGRRCLGGGEVVRVFVFRLLVDGVHATVLNGPGDSSSVKVRRVCIDRGQVRLDQGGRLTGRGEWQGRPISGRVWSVGEDCCG